MTENIKYLADKVFVHHWPKDTEKWSDYRTQQIELELNKNKEKKQIVVFDKKIHVDNYEFDSIKKVGITMPQFQRQNTMIFEARCQEFNAHVHITTKSDNYLEVLNKLVAWREKNFPESIV